ncbi:hypothetical protein LOK49_LG01G01872 [Camellia lanceoleosa]|uniref:Uncharacterized protein n=1 Tax=Camellia lanceoleosa TaxID=1840588 RepID=A0ACC0J5B2_9ERIC|nr:hypothetical protein LOK49_LG01G01872 [Camellia lanceoleosa]
MMCTRALNIMFGHLLPMETRSCRVHMKMHRE